MGVRPILFNTEMVKAILDGRKTCTRRLVKFLSGKNPQWTGYVKDGLMLYNGKNEPCVRKAPCNVGDILYVRETWSEWTDGYIYKAWEGPFPQPGESAVMKWHPSIHMPKEAARIWLKVTDIRVERLHAISEDEARSEGSNFEDGKNVGFEEKMKRTAIESFIEIWNSTIKASDIDRYGWDANPYVWVIEFARCEKPKKMWVERVDLYDENFFSQCQTCQHCYQKNDDDYVYCRKRKGKCQYKPYNERQISNE